MAITLGAGVSADSSGTSASPASAALTLTAGRQAVGLLIWQSTTITLTAPTLSGGGTMTLIGSPLTVTSTCRMQLCYHANIPGSGSQTMNGTLSGSAVWAASMIELQGGDTAAFYTGNEVSLQGDSNVGSVDPVPWSITTANTDDCIIVAIIHGGSVWSGMTGLTNFSFADIGVLANDGHHQLSAGAAGVKNFNGTQSVFSVYGIKGAAFKAGAAAAASHVPFNRGARFAEMLRF